MNIPLLLEMAAESLGDRSALGGRDAPIGYGDLQRYAKNAAAGLKDIPAERTAYIGLNSPSLAIALFASGMMGRAFAPLNYRLPDSDLARLVSRTAPSIAIVDDDMVSRIPPIEGVTTFTRSRFDTLARNPSAEVEENVIGEDDVAIMLFTSGTTGEPKAATLKHRHLVSYVISTVELGSAKPEEATLVSVPPYHIAGMSALLTGIYAGRRIVHLSAFSEKNWIAAVCAEGITHAMVVPTMLQRILDEMERSRTGLPSLRHVSYGGGRMPLAVIERAMRLLPDVDFVNAYGLTETSSTIAVLGPEDHRKAFQSGDPAAKRHLGSVGKPLPHIELEVRNSEGEPVPAGVAGEIWVRGDQVSGEYVGRRALRGDGWFPTNDGGWLDEEGFLFVDGRLDDVIVRGGENISPGEIEDVLRGHPAVADVAVVGVPDQEWGERIVAAVVLKGETSEDALRQWTRRQLRSTKTPDSIFFRTALPYNDTGKVLRRVLQTEFGKSAAVAHTIQEPYR